MREQQIKQRKHNDLLHKSKVTSSRMIKLSTLDEFTTQFTIIDTNNKKRRAYNTNILLLFVGNKHIEKKAIEEYYFPYPFTGEVVGNSKSNQYEDILKVVKVRYNTETELTRLFHIPNNSKNNNNPYILFVKKGDTIGRYQKFIPPRHRTQSSSIDIHNEYIKWVKSQLTIQISIGNRYSLPVYIFIIRNNNSIIHDNDILNSNYQRTLTNIQVGDQIYAFDTRLDLYQGNNNNNRQQRTSVSNYILAKTKSVLLLDEVVTSSKSEYTISTNRKCYDLSTSCYDWTHTPNGLMNKQCIINPEFYHNICPYTCGICTPTNTNINIYYQDVIYMMYHKPIHTIQPRVIQRLVILVREISIDFENIIRLRKNSAVTFFGIGLLLALNILLYKSSGSTSSSSRESGSRDDSPNNTKTIHGNNNNNIYNTLYEITLILLSLNISIAFYWFTQTNRIGLPFIILQNFHRNLSSIITNRYNLFKLILGSGIVSGTYARYLLCWFGTGSLLDDILMIILLVLLMCVRITIMHYMKRYNKYFGIQYNQIWMYNKNVVVVVFIVGCVVGIGFISLWRVVSQRSIRKRVSLPLVVLNLTVVSIVGSLALMDTHFTNDLLHVLELRKNAAFGFTLLGIISGMVVVEVINFITWTPVDDIMKVNGVVSTQLPPPQPMSSNGSLSNGYKVKEEQYEEEEEHVYEENEEYLYGEKEKYE